MPVAYLAGHGAGIQVHVEDLGAYLAGRQRCDAGARMGELSPPTSPWPPRSARLGKPTAGPARAAGHPPCPSTSTPIISGSPVNWLPASAGTALATHRPLPWPMNPVAEPMPPLWTAILTSSSFQYCRKLDLSTRSVSTKGVRQQSGYPPSSCRASRARDIRGIGQAQRLNASENIPAHGTEPDDGGTHL